MGAIVFTTISGENELTPLSSNHVHKRGRLIAPHWMYQGKLLRRPGEPPIAGGKTYHSDKQEGWPQRKLKGQKEQAVQQEEDRWEEEGISRRKGRSEQDIVPDT
ncbi:unnamed protein product [Lota lota]